jgi:DNA polymerase III subunit delta
MKITGARVRSFLGKPDAGLMAVLIFGPDHGLVRERSKILEKSLVGDPADPFAISELTPQAIKSDPSRLSDEAAAIPFGGGRKLVRVREAGDMLSGVMKAFLASPPVGDGFVIVESGELNNRSSLRRLFEGAKAAAAIACYADDGRNLRAIIAETLNKYSLTASRDAIAYLCENLGSDRTVTRSELEKLAIYMGQPGEISLADAQACVGDSAASSMDAVVYAAAAGNARDLERSLARVLSEGVSPIAILRAAARHFQRLHLVCGNLAAGISLDKAMAGLRPPVIFLWADAFRSQARNWSLDRLSRALELLLEAEMDCKSTGVPADAICGRALLRISQAAPNRGRNA